MNPEFIAYLEQNRKIPEPGETSNTKERHNRLLRGIESSLKLAGIYGSVRVFKEVCLVDSKGGSPVGEADLIVIDSNECVSVIEGKVVSGKKDSWFVKNLINQQLRRDYRFFKERFGIFCDMIGAYRVVGENGPVGGIHFYRIRKPIRDLISRI